MVQQGWWMKEDPTPIDRLIFDDTAVVQDCCTDEHGRLETPQSSFPMLQQLPRQRLWLLRRYRVRNDTMAVMHCLRHRHDTMWDGAMKVDCDRSDTSRCHTSRTMWRVETKLDDTIWCDTITRDSIRYDVISCNCEMMGWETTWYGTTRCDAIWHDMVWYHLIRSEYG